METILCVRDSDFDPMSSGDVLLSRAVPMERTPELECDPNYKQLVAYFVIADPRSYEILSYRRVKGSGEDRLLGRRSIGFGGHIKAGENFAQAVTRELSEEIWLPGQASIAGFLPHIYSPTDPVGSVHIGLCAVVHVENIENQRDIRQLSKDPGVNVDFIGMPAQITVPMFGEMENWSRILFGNYLDLVSKPNESA